MKFRMSLGMSLAGPPWIMHGNLRGELRGSLSGEFRRMVVF